ncbi:Smr/MutS family endonuclease, partial [Salmonella enterica subsp. enterica serovar Kentucky]|nr:Smr/MutS family endonuclease [Salmonella enterica subsp. enterica serovar Kentucky]
MSTCVSVAEDSQAWPLVTSTNDNCLGSDCPLYKECFVDILPLNEPLEFRREGLQQGVIDKLRSGKYPQQASLNLLRQPV